MCSIAARCRNPCFNSVSSGISGSGSASRAWWDFSCIPAPFMNRLFHSVPFGLNAWWLILLTACVTYGVVGMKNGRGGDGLQDVIAGQRGTNRPPTNHGESHFANPSLVRVGRATTAGTSTSRPNDWTHVPSAATTRSASSISRSKWPVQRQRATAG